MQCTIRDRWTGRILADGEFDDLRACVVAKVKEGADLAGAYLSGADLTGAYLRGAYLSGADLTGAYLRGADLTGADLAGADLRGAYLTDAYLAGADLTDADLTGAYLTGADLRGADLTGADGARLALVGDRPFLQVGPIGSREDSLRLWITDQGPRVQSGCFFGTLEAFAVQVLATHGENVHAQEYGLALTMLRMHVSAWPRTAKDDQIATDLANREAEAKDDPAPVTAHDDPDYIAHLTRQGMLWVLPARPVETQAPDAAPAPAAETK
jgi:hypothetical protein